MTSIGAKVLCWNLRWAKPRTRRGRALAARISATAPDLVCLTEASEDFELPQGHRALSDPDYGYVAPAYRRKVVLWSAQPWMAVTREEGDDLPGGRLVRGRTATPAGELDVWGVCVPWRDAHVRTGRRDRAPWEDHLSFLEGLVRRLRAAPPQVPRVVLGDLNQRVPREREPRRVAEAREAALEGLQVPTEGWGGIDHLACSSGLSCGALRRLDAEDDGQRLSDHHGFTLDLRT